MPPMLISSFFYLQSNSLRKVLSPFRDAETEDLRDLSTLSKVTQLVNPRVRVQIHLQRLFLNTVGYWASL